MTMSLKQWIRSGFTTRQAELLKSEIAAAGGGSAGSPVVRKFPFAYNTPGLLTGVAVYTPTVGDVLLDAWIEVITRWDGVTPYADIGTFTGIAGLFDEGLPIAVNLLKADAPSPNNDGLLVGDNTNPTSVNLLSVNAVTLANSRGVPLKFTAANPIKVCVSQDGTTTGADPGSTQGAAVLYLITATPA